MTPLAHAMAAAHQAATDALIAAGMQPDAVVINIAWSSDHLQYVAGSSVPADAPVFLAQSLRQSAEEIEHR